MLRVNTIIGFIAIDKMAASLFQLKINNKHIGPDRQNKRKIVIFSLPFSLNTYLGAQRNRRI